MIIRQGTDIQERQEATAIRQTLVASVYLGKGLMFGASMEPGMIGHVLLGMLTRAILTPERGPMHLTLTRKYGTGMRLTGTLTH